MPSESVVLRLTDILENIAAIEEYTGGLSELRFREDHKTQDAVERCLLRISEAARKLQDTAEFLVPDQPWSEIRAVGNVLRHEYDRIDPLIIWRIVGQDLSPLRAAVEATVEKLRREES